jgi:hypothetical protein
MLTESVRAEGQILTRVCLTSRSIRRDIPYFDVKCATLVKDLQLRIDNCPRFRGAFLILNILPTDIP